MTTRSERTAEHRNTVVILSQDDDIHALAVTRAIRARYPEYDVVTVDGRHFPQRSVLSISAGEWRLDGPWGLVQSERVRSVWHRRPQPPVIDDAILDASARKFAIQECNLAFDFISLSSAYRVVNRVERHFAANRKPYQLHVAKQCGLNVPEYAITNDPRVMTDLLDTYGDDVYVYKTLGPAAFTMAETRALNESHRGSGDLVAYAPVIFQRKIERAHEYRVTVIGTEIFVHEIVVHNSVVKELPDWRLDLSAQSVTASIGEDVLAKLREFMSRLHLSYGAIDLIEDPNGALWFLEVNPQGQFLFGEADTGAPMCAAFARLLGEATDAAELM